MFAVLFGLSMDYEVFLLSSVRETFLRTGDSTTSVVDGLASTARVITSAALIMVAVFLGFAFDPSVVIKMIGVGMSAAIAIDATLIRLIVVPSAMALLGQWSCSRSREHRGVRSFRISEAPDLDSRSGARCTSPKRRSQSPWPSR